jgi:hypothetical protein
MLAGRYQSFPPATEPDALNVEAGSFDAWQLEQRGAASFAEGDKTSREASRFGLSSVARGQRASDGEHEPARRLPWVRSDVQRALHVGHARERITTL